MVIHDGIIATMSARYPKIIDLSCGFQSYLPSGTCSNVRLERSTSRSSSARKSSVSFIRHSLSRRPASTDFHKIHRGRESTAHVVVEISTVRRSTYAEYEPLPAPDKLGHPLARMPYSPTHRGIT